MPSTLGEWIQQTQADRRHFGDDEEMAGHLVDLLEHVRDTSLCDDTGSVDGLRVWLEDNLDAAHVLNDRFELPVDYHIDALEAAIRQHDKRERAKETLDDVRKGKYA